MSNDNGSASLKIGLKNFLKVIIILYSILIIVGILTYVITPGAYDVDRNGKITDINSFHYLDSTDRVPFYRWPTAPFEALILGKDVLTIVIIMVILVILGGCFKVLEACGAINSLIRFLVYAFKGNRYLAIWGITLVMMLLSSLFGLQEELLLLLPIFMSFATAMNWSRTTAVSFVLITTGVGFTSAIFNPFTVGICSGIAGVAVTSGIWYRIAIFVLLYVLTSLYLIWVAKKDEKNNNIIHEQNADQLSLQENDKKNALAVFTLFGSILVVVVVFSIVPALRDYSMAVMGVAFLIGTLIVGNILMKDFKKWGKSFLSGALDIAPSLYIIMTAFSVKYIAERAGILHTLFYYMYGWFTGMSPYVTVLIIYVFVLLLEFLIPSSSAKAYLIMPLLTLAKIPGVSVNILILCYLFGDGYTNVLYPTCGTLMIGLGIADVGYMEWLKKTGLFQLSLLALSMMLIWLGVAIGI